MQNVGFLMVRLFFFYLKIKLLISLDTSFDPDPRVRHSFWTVVVGGGMVWMANMGVNQAWVQRAVSVRSVKHSRM